MTVLEIARELAALAQAGAANGGIRWKVRVAFWTGEEAGMMGSTAFATALGSARDGPIRAYLNFDMLGSPNGIRVVYDGAMTSRPPESSVIGGLFTTALGAAGLTWELQTVGAASDHWPLEQAGIPIGGLFSGAGELKSAEQAALFGGSAGTRTTRYHRRATRWRTWTRSCSRAGAAACGGRARHLARSRWRRPEGRPGAEGTPTPATAALPLRWALVVPSSVR
jgi:Zn-dependent M28 family amino/carboxypeptidase